MAGKMFKGTLLVSLMLVMAIGAPAMTNAQTGDVSISQFEDIGDFEAIGEMLPSVFDQMGGAGQLIGQILMLLLPQFMNLTNQEIVPGFYVLNATAEITDSTTIYLSQKGQTRTYYPDYNYYEAEETNLDNAYPDHAYPYCVVNRSGSGVISVNTTTGMSITVGIWDADGTLIRTINHIITSVKNIMRMASEDEGYKAAMQEAVSAIMYLLIHINDIITGDELIVFNPITYTYTRTNGSFTETHDWKIDTWTSGVKTVHNMESQSPAILDSWNATALSEDNGFMKWLLGPGVSGAQDVTWGKFSFDLIQLWLKRFYVSIDMQEIVNMIQASQSGSTSSVNPAKILKDINIEFYFLWHHLMGGVFYNDTNNDGYIDVQYQDVTYSNGTKMTTENGTVIQSPSSTEVTHLIGMKTMNSVTWKNPVPNTDGSVSWGVRFNNMQIFWTPVGMDAEDHMRSNPLTGTLEFMDLGFTFKPGDTKTLYNIDGTPSDKTGRDGQVKLDQHFGRWNAQPSSIDPQLAGLDFAMVYVSTLIHVKFDAKLLEKLAGGSGEWDEGSNEGTVVDTNVRTSHEIKFGSEAGSNDPMVGKIDIAGPGYDIYEWAAPSTNKVSVPAYTQTIPLALFTMDAQAGMDYSDATGGFTGSASLGIEFQVSLYSVNYPMFNETTYNGGKIWHDPTFSIFMTFEAQTYWAVILLVGVVALVGVAAILITRSKSNR